MIPPDAHFFISSEKALVDGIKYSNILDFKEGKIYRINASAKRIIDLGEGGLTVSEVEKKIHAGLSRLELHSFLEDLANKDLIALSVNPKPKMNDMKPEPRLDFIWIEVTPKCNLRCIHCYAEASSAKNWAQALPRNIIEKAIDDAANLGCKSLQFTGGEPTLRRDLKELILHAKDRCFETIEIFTNGTNLDEPMISFCAKNGVHIAMSIYSYCAEKHDRITGVPGSFDRTINSLKLILAYNIPVRCEVVAMKQNEDDLDATTFFLSKLGVCTRSPDPVRPTGRGYGLKNWPHKYGARFLQTKPRFIVTRESYEIKKNWNSCWFGKAAIASNGDVLPCVFAREQVAGNLKKQNLADIIYGKKMLDLWAHTKNKVETCKLCENRYICEDCTPWSYGFTGRLDAKSPRCTYDPNKGEWASVETSDLSGNCLGKHEV